MADAPSILELGAGGWRVGGAAWTPPGPFYAVVGDPVTHSRSPAMQMAGFRERGIANSYLAARVPGGSLGRLRTGDWDPGLAGFNVTAPLKEEAFDLCDELSDDARQARAVNTVRVTAGRWTGHNTDVAGIQATLSDRWRWSSPPDCATVFGTGGSARAAVLALALVGAGRIRVRGRSASGRRRFRDWLHAAGLKSSAVTLEEQAASRVGDAPEPPRSGARVWIVCLPPEAGYPPDLDTSSASAHGLLLDLRYGPALPPAPGLGADVTLIDGLPVLLAQGGRAFAWWFGPPVPWRAMGAAVAGAA